MSHTPGPWEAKWPKYDSLIVDTVDRIIAAVSFSDHADAECEANAYLIAAAPDLLESLKSLFNTGLVREFGSPEEAAAKAAIAKAEHL